MINRELIMHCTAVEWFVTRQSKKAGAAIKPLLLDTDKLKNNFSK